MKALRIKLYQKSANYRKEETVENKMTYPLPPFSTVIGALHNACGFTSYQEMYLSIQGSYGALTREVYVDHTFLRRFEDDRGILVKMDNPHLLSKSYKKIAKAQKGQGNSFRKEITIEVFDKDLLKEYQNICDLRDDLKTFETKRIKPIKAHIKKRVKVLKEKTKKFDKGSDEEKRIQKRVKELQALNK